MLRTLINLANLKIRINLLSRYESQLKSNDTNYFYSKFGDFIGSANFLLLFNVMSFTLNILVIMFRKQFDEM